MKVVENALGEKRYKFEDTDLIAKRKFEEGLAGTTPEELSVIIDLLISKAGQRSSESWQNVREAIISIDPTATIEISNLGYNWFTGEFRILTKDVN